MRETFLLKIKSPFKHTDLYIHASAMKNNEIIKAPVFPKAEIIVEARKRKIKKSDAVEC